MLGVLHRDAAAHVRQAVRVAGSRDLQVQALLTRDAERAWRVATQGHLMSTQRARKPKAFIRPSKSRRIPVTAQQCDTLTIPTPRKPAEGSYWLDE